MPMQKIIGGKSPSHLKAWRTKRDKYGQAEIIANARRAGLMSTGKITSATTRDLNKIRWAKYYARYPEKLVIKLERERKKKLKDARKNNERTST